MTTHDDEPEDTNEPEGTPEKYRPDPERADADTTDTIEANTKVQGRYAVNTGTTDISNAWSATEEWVVQSHEPYWKRRRHHADVQTYYGNLIETKGACVKHHPNSERATEHGKIVVRRSQHNQLLDESDPEYPNMYHCVVRQQLGSRVIHVIADTTLPVTAMDDILDGYQWTTFERGGNTIHNAHVPWPEIPGLDKTDVRLRARITQYITPLVKECPDLDVLCEELESVLDLVELLQEHSHVQKHLEHRWNLPAN